MATAPAPKTQPAAAPRVAAPRVAEEVHEVEEKPIEVHEVEEKPIFERVNIAGLVLDKTLYPDGEYEVTLVDEPRIDPSLIRATRTSQRRRGH